ncbi:hypothetical protein [Shouchella patagoniensis]|uniref:hypothetical protein n=1 Tax=Shouchella patagoniensis TaxID=228576 RepID=UPI0014761D7E|nr:hypothetical protein [Shouchella patagoniensis]
MKKLIKSSILTVLTLGVIIGSGSVAQAGPINPVDPAPKSVVVPLGPTNPVDR